MANQCRTTEASFKSLQMYIIGGKFKTKWYMLDYQFWFKKKDIKIALSLFQTLDTFKNKAEHPE